MCGALVHFMLDLAAHAVASAGHTAAVRQRCNASASARPACLHPCIHACTHPRMHTATPHCRYIQADPALQWSDVSRFFRQVSHKAQQAYGVRRRPLASAMKGPSHAIDCAHTGAAPRQTRGMSISAPPPPRACASGGAHMHGGEEAHRRGAAGWGPHGQGRGARGGVAMEACNGDFCTPARAWACRP